MNQVGQVAEAGRPKWRVRVYDCHDYRGYYIYVTLEPEGHWCGDVEKDGNELYCCIRHTPDDAQKAVVAWVDAQEKA